MTLDGGWRDYNVRIAGKKSERKIYIQGDKNKKHITLEKAGKKFASERQSHYPDLRFHFKKHSLRIFSDWIMLAKVTAEREDQLSIDWWLAGVEKTGIHVTAAMELFDEVDACKEDSSQWRSAASFRA